RPNRATSALGAPRTPASVGVGRGEGPVDPSRRTRRESTSERGDLRARGPADACVRGGGARGGSSGPFAAHPTRVNVRTGRPPRSGPRGRLRPWGWGAGRVQRTLRGAPDASQRPNGATSALGAPRTPASVGVGRGEGPADPSRRTRRESTSERGDLRARG